MRNSAAVAARDGDFTRRPERAEHYFLLLDELLMPFDELPMLDELSFPWAEPVVAD